MSNADVGGMAVEVEPSCQKLIIFAFIEEIDQYKDLLNLNKAEGDSF